MGRAGQPGFPPLRLEVPKCCCSLSEEGSAALVRGTVSGAWQRGQSQQLTGQTVRSGQSASLLSQVVEAKEAGAAGVLGAIANVCGPRGAPVLSSYAAAIGLDCPVEVTRSCYLSSYWLRLKTTAGAR